MTNAQKVDPGAPLQEGEFRRIKGIAETTERALRSAGIETFDHLAMLTPEEIAAALPGNVGVKERAARQDWAGQAALFAQQLAEDKPAERAGRPQAQGKQHYESFMVVLLIDDDQRVRRTTVTHVQDDLTERWAGWEPQRMTGWIAEQAGISAARPAGHTGAVDLLHEGDAKASEKQRGTEQRPPGSLTGELSFSSPRLEGPSQQGSGLSIPAGQPFAVTLDLDLSQVKSARAKSLRYYAAAHVRQLANWAHLEAVRLEGEARPGEMHRLEFSLPGLQEGAHHLEVAVLVAPEGADNPVEEGLGALTEGLLVRVKAEEKLPAAMML